MWSRKRYSKISYVDCRVAITIPLEGAGGDSGGVADTQGGLFLRLLLMIFFC